MLSRKEAEKAGLYCQWWYTPCILCKRYRPDTGYCDIFSYIPNPQKTFCKWFKRIDRDMCCECKYYDGGKCYRCYWLVSEQDESCCYFKRKCECTCDR